jgi:signal transduction histidine kinase
VELVLRAVADPSVQWIVRERAEVGRMREVDIPLHDPSISKLHALIEHIDGRYVVADLGSKNGTRLNGVPLQGTQELAPGDRIQFGTVELVVDAVASGGPTALLLKLCQSLLSAPGLDEVLRVALDQFIGLTAADRGAVLLLDQGVLRCSLGRRRTPEGRLEDLPPAEFEFTETLAWSVVEAGRSRIVHDAVEDEMLSNALSVLHLGVTGAVCVPLLAPRWDGGVKKLGVLYGDSLRAIRSSVPLDLLEGIGGLIALAIESSRTQRDLRSQSQVLEEKVAERTAELQLKHRALLESEKMAATGLLAAGVAHELGNALLQVSANVELIREFACSLEEELHKHVPQLFEGGAGSDGGPGVLELLSDLKEASALCLVGAEMSQRTVRDLKSFARLDEAKVKLVSLDQAFETVVRLVEKGVGRPQRFELVLGALPKLWCYPERMNQVFLNFLVNAVQASAPGQKISASSRAEDDSYLYVVQDEGSGIEPEILGRIFEPFFTTKKVGEGSGLGLALAYQIVAEHGGRIEVASAPGRGSRFSVVLPASLRDRPPAVPGG